MIFSYRNGELITEDEMLIVTDEEKETLKSIKIEDGQIKLHDIPQFDTDYHRIYYLQQGMYLYLISYDRRTDSTHIAYIIEQAVEHGKMRIKNIDSYIVVSNDEMLLRYCLPNKVDEKKNIVIGVKEILDQLKFMQDKEKEYLVNKIEEFFGDNEQIKVLQRKVLGIDREKGLPRGLAKQIEYGGETFTSIARFTEKYGISRNAFDYAYRIGMSLDEIVEKYSRKKVSQKRHSATRLKIPFEYNGETFKSIVSFAAKHQINLSSMNNALKKRYDIR